MVGKIGQRQIEARTTLETCTLNVADAGPHPLQDIADFIGLTRERTRQVEDIALRKLAQSADRALLREMNE